MLKKIIFITALLFSSILSKAQPDIEFVLSEFTNNLFVQQIPDMTLERAPEDPDFLFWGNSPQKANCMILEGCAYGLYNRRLLRFETETKNIGNAAFIVGEPPPDGQDGGVFIWDPCHEHHHFETYAEYNLYDMTCDNQLPALSGKRGFCVFDNQWALHDNNCVVTGPDVIFKDCDNQGLSPGCADQYDIWTPCSFLDITDLPDGKYLLRVIINYDQVLFESDYNNNRGYFLLDIQGTHLTLLYSGHTIPSDLFEFFLPGYTISTDEIINNAGALSSSKGAKHNIETSNNVSIANGSQIDFVAGNEIILGDGFVAEQGSVFNAIITCPNPVGRKANPDSSNSGKTKGGTTTTATQPANNQQSAIDNEQSKNKSSINNQQSPITILPNPNSGKFTISSQEAIKNITVINILGEVIYEKRNNTNLQNEIIDISNQPKGIYFVKVQSEDGFTVHKIIYQ